MVMAYEAQLPISTFLRSTTIGMGGCGLIWADAGLGASAIPRTKASKVFLSMTAILAFIVTR
jgi:hypothetical protein